MFKYLKSIFAPEATPEATFDDTATSIRQRKNGRFVLLTNGNEVVADYATRHGALRGAARRGLEVTDVQA